jgi:hypothetical protein
MAIDPLRVPVAVGVKVTLIVQLAPASTEVPQLFICVKSPLGTMLVMVSVSFPVLESVTLCAVLGEPTPVLGKGQAGSGEHRLRFADTGACRRNGLRAVDIGAGNVRFASLWSREDWESGWPPASETRNVQPSPPRRSCRSGPGSPELLVS